MHIDNIEKTDECVLSFTKIGISSLRQKHWVIKVQRASKLQRWPPLLRTCGNRGITLEW